MRAFKKMDMNSDGYITHNELEKALTTVSSLTFFLIRQTNNKLSFYCFKSMFQFWLLLLLMSELSDVVESSK